MGHDEDVVRLEAADPARRLEEQPGKVVAFLELGDALEREELDSDHSKPVSRIPACTL
jgi:hypothetical protein